MMVHVNGDIWSAAGVSVKPVARIGQTPAGDEFRMVAVERAPRTSGELTPELARSLRDWLSYQLGETPECPQPDDVRMAVDEQRAELRRRSAELVSEDFRAGLAWGENALRKVSDAVEGRRTA